MILKIKSSTKKRTWDEQSKIWREHMVYRLELRGKDQDEFIQFLNKNFGRDGTQWYQTLHTFVLHERAMTLAALKWPTEKNTIDY